MFEVSGRAPARCYPLGTQPEIHRAFLVFKCSSVAPSDADNLLPCRALLAEVSNPTVTFLLDNRALASSILWCSHGSDMLSPAHASLCSEHGCANASHPVSAAVLSHTKVCARLGHPRSLPPPRYGHGLSNPAPPTPSQQGPLAHLWKWCQRCPWAGYSCVSACAEGCRCHSSGRSPTGWWAACKSRRRSGWVLGAARTEQS